MILFALRCAHDHHFEGWFKDGAAYESQAAAAEIACPVCGDTAVSKALMAPRLARGRGGDAHAHAREAAHEMRRMLGDLRRTVEEHCDYVGDRFAEEARRIHYGETASRPIYGETTQDQARDLAEEGVEVQRIPWVPPDN